MRTYITLVIFIIIAAASYWLLQDTTKEITTEKKPEMHFPDYFMENFSIISMNSKGQPEYKLKAKKMLHYSDNDSAELEQAFLNFTQPDNNLTLQASRATYLQQENKIFLYGNVIIHRAASKTQGELSIYTDYLKIDTATHIAETNLAARIKTAEAELNTIGMVLDNYQGIITLQSQVKGIYEENH